MAQRPGLLARLLVAIGTAAALGIVAPVPAAGSCVGPVLMVGESSSPPYSSGPPVAVRRGGELVVSGEWFREGCADTYASTGGCDPQPIPTETERPLTDVELVLEQAGRGDRTLAVADAAGSDFTIRWTVRVPADAQVGLASITAAGASLPIDVRP